MVCVWLTFSAVSPLNADSQHNLLGVVGCCEGVLYLMSLVTGQLVRVSSYLSQRTFFGQLVPFLVNSYPLSSQLVPQKSTRT